MGPEWWYLPSLQSTAALFKAGLEAEGQSFFPRNSASALLRSRSFLQNMLPSHYNIETGQLVVLICTDTGSRG